MSGGRSWKRAIGRVAPGLAVALPVLPWVACATVVASFTPLYRDQAIFQYVAWALLRGVKDYGELRDVNGPFTHLVHLVFLLLGGADEHRFRVLDLVVTGAAFAFVAACLPGLARRGRVSWIERLAWGAAGYAVLDAQYLVYDWGTMAQRESFCDWLVLASVGVQLLAHRELALLPWSRRGPRALVVAGVLAAIPVFGKPTYAVFPALQIVLLLVDSFRLPRAQRLALLALGGAIGSAVMLLFVIRYGDVAAFARQYFVETRVMYRFIWARRASVTFAMPPYRAALVHAACTTAAIVALVVAGAMPRRALLVTAVPVGGIVSVLAQQKGFPYHFHPVTAGVWLEWLALVVWAWERTAARARGRALVWVAPLAASGWLAYHAVQEIRGVDPFAYWSWARDARSKSVRESKDFLARFKTFNYDPELLREAASYVRAHTAPADRVQVYGTDPYVLFLARRLSATPYIYAWDLNVDAALRGDPDGLHPNAAQADAIRALRDANEADLLRRLKAKPPAAFVFIDHAPFLSEANAFSDFQSHSSETAAWVSSHYAEAASFGWIHVWLPGGAPRG